MTPTSELDPVIHAPARLRLVATLSALSERDRLSFTRLQTLLEMTGGNLSTHLRRLEDAGYVKVTKTHEGRTPKTYAALTRAGRLAFENYTAALRVLLAPPTAQTTIPGTDIAVRSPNEVTAERSTL